ncbi:MAG: hypothetical protein JNM17_13135 [Archangium sp.]|nr:hypothetical protein [Archangium sp.]
MRVTDSALALIEDRLRETTLDEGLIKRMLFAARPDRPHGEICSTCGIDLATRPVLTTVNRRRGDGSLINKRVHMKPVQVVATFRTEGSHGMTPGLHARLPGGVWRFCAKCAVAMLSDSETPPRTSPPSETTSPREETP